MQTQQIKAIFLTHLNLNKASVLPVQTLSLFLSTHTQRYTNIFLSPLGKPFSVFSLHSVQITSRWDKSIRFPDPPPHASLFWPRVLLQFFPPPTPPFVPDPKGHSHFIKKKEVEGWWGGQEAKRVNKTSVINSRAFAAAASQSELIPSPQTELFHGRNPSPGPLELPRCFGLQRIQNVA